MQIDVEKIRVLRARYCRFLDTKQWDAFSQLLTEDIVIEFYDPSGTLQMKVEGRDEMVR
ncbi:MAG: nuclear transport factor 2 family protein, partial [Flavisolibacter sp.]|nr:nuclear transport factor 2 family protein [Flavisolibacter sp.]